MRPLRLFTSKGRAGRRADSGVELESYLSAIGDAAGAYFGAESEPYCAVDLETCMGAIGAKLKVEAFPFRSPFYRQVGGFCASSK